MSVLKKLSELVTKNDLENKILITPSLFSSPLLPSKNINVPNTNSKNINDPSTKTKNISKLYENRQISVGKRSAYQKNLVKDYLSSFEHIRPFKRLTIQDDYDVERAKKLNLFKKKISTNPKFKETQDEIFLGRIIPILIRQCKIPVNKTKLHFSSIPKRIYPKDSYDEIPIIPNFQEDPQAFANYIGLLTHTNFHFKNSSSTNGIIPTLLRTLLHPMNKTTGPYQTTETFNDMIYYFYQKSDLASMRESLAILKLSNCKPDIKTYNLMLSGLLKNSNNESSPNENKNLIYYLERMIKDEVRADSITWNILFQFLETDKGRTVFMEAMRDLNIEITYRFIITLIKNSQSTQTMSGLSILKLFQQYNIRMNNDILKFCIKRFLRDGQLNHALTTIEHVSKETKSSMAEGNLIIPTVINSDTLNLFLYHFGNAGRLDLSLMSFNTFTKDYDVKPNSTNFEMLFKSLVRNGYSKNFPIIHKWIKVIRLKWTKEMRNNYWKVKADSIAKFNCLKDVHEDDIKIFDTMISNFKLKENNSSGYNTWSNATKDERKILRYINCRPNSIMKEKLINNKTNNLIKNNKNTYQQKKKYRENICKIAIKHATIKRIPYAADWYEGLNKELKDRKLLQETTSLD
ncbi:similar to Saccharomyces cerevisiae YPL005W AEP3 Protein that may facilitate use of unformylated tRNA-Met in mitochondrial translation initiation [Maudiozyma saulgeensis]|uniref:Similar to Saccharomyces cerevisiae YPL005W AEP3 Protein that may facilitate use of unformylated tRNA-Met in mitochondrial translation initiation n=1 Tax=Maudiozyma saulgeensis TaxID=1789683 RepID=A0A1X7RAT2_9SACH|nr:similar to Saccharomyces cerevisiae YPL005W AEP3 Protein that may facilitate use of unformylated tRNA-Met in mitochondrial translation initiation [Kazachstania saulgeensis]